MKKLLTWIALAAMIISMSACTAKPSDKTELVSDADDISGSEYSISIGGIQTDKKMLELKTINPVEYEIFGRSLELGKDSAANRPEMMTVEVAGKKITGSYSETIESIYYRSTTNYYKSLDVEFGIDPVTGSLTYYNAWEPTMFGGDVTYSEKELLKIAVNFIVSIEPNFDLDNYVIETMVHVSNGRNSYFFDFNKYLGDVMTGEYVHVSIVDNGHVYHYSSNQFGEYDNVDISKINISQIAEQTKNKISLKREKAAAGSDQVKRTGVSIDENAKKYILKCKDGTYVLQITLMLERKPVTVNGELYPSWSGETYVLRLE